MRPARLLILMPILFGVASAAADGDAAPARHACVEVHASPAECWVGQPFTVTIAIGLDREFFEKQAVPLFARAVGLPVKVEAPWLEGIPDTVLLSGSPPPGAALPTIAINDRVAAVDGAGSEDRHSGPFTVLRIERRYLPLSPGEIRIAAPVLRYAFATQFAEDFLDDRRPIDRQEGRETGEEVLIRVFVLPAAGRPADFGGAVGRYEVRAEVSPIDGSDGKTGPTFRVRLRIEGDGNLAFFDPPRLDGLPDFHVFGLLDDRGSPVRTVTCDVAPVRPGVTALPPIPFSFFDPGPPAAYRTIRTPPVPLDTPAGSAGTGVGESAGPEGPAPAAGDSGPPAALLAVAGVLLLAAAAVVLRRRARSRPDPEVLRVQAAASAFRERMSRPGAELSEAFTAFLAARLSCTEAQVVAPDLRERLRRAGFPEALAEEIAALLDSLVASRYGGRPPGPEALKSALRLTNSGSDPKPPF